jgi:hypothetical protein
MKTTIKHLRKIVREGFKKFEKEGVSQSKRVRHGYANDEPKDYDTGGEGLGEGEQCPFMKGHDKPEEEEGVSQSKRAKFGYGNEEPKDYDVGGIDIRTQNKEEEGKEDEEMPSLKVVSKEKTVDEASPPSKKAEEFIMKNKEEFKKRYGKRWKEVLYSTAWKKFGQE